MSHFEMQAAKAIERNATDLQKLQRQFNAQVDANKALVTWGDLVMAKLTASIADNANLFCQLKYALEEIETLKDRVNCLEKND